MALYNNRNSKIKIFELLKKIYNSCRNRFLKNKIQSTIFGKYVYENMCMNMLANMCMKMEERSGRLKT